MSRLPCLLSYNTKIPHFCKIQKILSLSFPPSPSPLGDPEPPTSQPFGLGCSCLPGHWGAPVDTPPLQKGISLCLGTQGRLCPPSASGTVPMGWGRAGPWQGSSGQPSGVAAVGLARHPSGPFFSRSRAPAMLCPVLFMKSMGFSLFLFMGVPRTDVRKASQEGKVKCCVLNRALRGRNSNPQPSMPRCSAAGRDLTPLPLEPNGLIFRFARRLTLP